MDDVVDIFIPVKPDHFSVLPAALYSALTQTYPSIRIVLWLDGTHDRMEQTLQKWWYSPLDAIRDTENLEWNGLPLTYEYCHRGVLIRNPSGPSKSAHNARQWLFEWNGLSPFVKNLDADDILTPQAVKLMMGYMGKGIDGVLTPILKTRQYSHSESLNVDFSRGVVGSGAMLLRKETLRRMISEGFSWPKGPAHDKGMLEFFRTKLSTYNFVPTKENALYLYLR